MKKFLIITVVFLMIGALCSSCSNDKGNDLVGTEWIMEEESYSNTIAFETESTVSWSVMFDGIVGNDNQGTYGYNAPNIAIILYGRDGDIYVEAGTIDGTIMTLTDQNGHKSTYNRK